MDNLINQIMEVGRKLVAEFEATSKSQTKATVINEQYHLVFSKVYTDDNWNACLYDFGLSSHPMLVFGPEVYDPRQKDTDAAYWAPLVVLAQTQFGIARQLDDVIGMTVKNQAARISERARNATLGKSE